jgi:hypothetical protein
MAGILRGGGTERNWISLGELYKDIRIHLSEVKAGKAVLNED